MIKPKKNFLLDEIGNWKRALGNEKPSVINFQVNDICNHKCVMCNIWTKKLEYEIDTDTFRRLLGDPYFSEVKHVGITGGEPTMRSDLAEFYEVLIPALPKLEAASFITNGFLPERVVEVYTKVHRHFHDNGKSFSGMVSIDGTGTVHDKVRGKIGAFDRGTRSLFGLRERGVPVIACCTIVRDNVYFLRDLLAWGKANGVYVRFRVAEFINRLYNSDLSSQIRNFDAFEKRHLISFIYLLLTEYEQDERIRRTYTSILSILTGGNRLVQCPYQTPEGVNLDSRGTFAHCAPKGSPHAIGNRAASSIGGHRLERLNIRRKYCPTCIHDYHADWTPREDRRRSLNDHYDEFMYGFAEGLFPTEEMPIRPFDLQKMKNILFIGWYGTETAGDIAILQGIMLEYLRINQALKFVVLSFYPFYTQNNISEFEPGFAAVTTVLPYHGYEAYESALKCDAIVMAGGPLMDITETKTVADLFLFGSQLKKHLVIEGCGVGPLEKEEFKKNVVNMLKLATRVTVRDTKSKRLLEGYGIRKEIIVRSDPSRTYIERTGTKHTGTRNNLIRCFLRELTHEYPQAISAGGATVNLTVFLKNMLEWFPEYTIELLAMHYFPIGQDDREYAKTLQEKVNDTRLVVDMKPRTPREILSAIAESSFCVCMRLHSVIFASTINAPYIAVDYTSGGKVAAYLEDIDRSSKAVMLKDVAAVKREEFERMLAA